MLSYCCSLLSIFSPVLFVCCPMLYLCCPVLLSSFVLVLSSIVLVLSSTFLMSSFCYGYMFMNKISMSQTCLYNFSYKKSYRIFTTTSIYRGHLATVQHNTNFAKVHTQVILGGCSVDYEYKLLRQFTTTVGGTSCYLWLKQSQSNSLQGHTGPHEAFFLIFRNRTERQWLKG